MRYNRRKGCNRTTTLKRFTIHRRPRQKRCTLLRRPLSRTRRQTIPPVIKLRQPETHRSLAGEEIVAVSEILKLRKLTNTRRNLPRQPIMSHIQLLHRHHPADTFRQRPHKLVKANIKHRHVLQPPDIPRQTRVQPIVHENNLIQILHLNKTRRYTTMEPVIR